MAMSGREECDQSRIFFLGEVLFLWHLESEGANERVGGGGISFSFDEWTE